MSNTLLQDLRLACGLSDDDDSFDVSLLMFANSTMSTLTQNGIGPADGILIDSATMWADITESVMFVSMKTYICLQVRLLFDPPSTSYVIDASQRQLDMLLYRLSITREEASWVNPNTTP